MASLAPAVIGPQVWEEGACWSGSCGLALPTARPVENSPRRVGDEPWGWARMLGHSRAWGVDPRHPKRND